MHVGILGGTGLLVPDAPADASVQVETPWGAVELSSRPLDAPEAADRRCFFVSRHGRGHTVAPHAIKHEAHAWALRACGVTHAIGIHNTGGLDPTLVAGSVVIPDDLVDLGAASRSLYEDAVVHVDMQDPFARHLREVLADALADARPGNTPRVPVHRGGVYVNVSGPRLETAAETKRLQKLGAVVGMTAAGEAVAMREAGIPFASLCLVANAAPGRDDDASIEVGELQARMQAASDRLVNVAMRALASVPDDVPHRARDAPRLGRVA